MLKHIYFISHAGDTEEVKTKRESKTRKGHGTQKNSSKKINMLDFLRSRL